MLQSKIAKEINRIKVEKGIVDENDLYSDGEVKELSNQFYTKKGEILTETVKF